MKQNSMRELYWVETSLALSLNIPILESGKVGTVAVNYSRIDPKYRELVEQKVYSGTRRSAQMR